MAAKVSKASVKYRIGTPTKHCGNCTMYRPSNAGKGQGECTLVRGIIMATMVCDRWYGNDQAPSK